MSPVARSESNGKVTMAVLSTKLDRLLEDNDKLLHEFRRHVEQSSERDRRISLLEQSTTRIGWDVKEVREDLEAVTKRSYTLDGLVAAIAAAGSAIAAWWGSK